MLRFVYCCTVGFFLIIFYLCKLNYIEKHSERYDELSRYQVARDLIRDVKRKGRITTDVYGLENLPKEGGYVMYPNHQGKYDTLGIIDNHDRPCTILIDEQRSKMILTNEVIRLIRGARLDKSSPKKQVQTILDVAEQVKNGRIYIVFPEGGYRHNRNTVQEFMPGAFKCSMKSRTPIVPVALVDSWKPFEVNSLKKVKTQVHFLPPIPYEEYKNMNSREIADMVRGIISRTVEQYA
ncbi:MAG: 1-acyl-sn-glycerol-3-phosphate acyltransferase [Lachnospiraceae bacterium]|nr:1-acyl-sn-glycerol-3-phosphate acyltransferase [Lachnospiraceae bacterium]